MRCAYPGYEMQASPPEQLHRIAAADLRLFVGGQVQALEGFDGAVQADLRVVRAQQHVVQAHVAQGPEKFLFDRGIGHHQHGGGDVEVEVVEAEAVGGTGQGEDVPEAEVQAADVGEDELRPRYAHHQVEQFFAVAGQDVGVVHQHGDAEFAGTAREGFHARVGHVEALGVGVDLQHLHSGGGHAGQFGQGGVAVVGVDGGDGQYVGVGGGQGDHLVVAGADLVQLALPGLVGAAEPHGADAGQLQAGGVDLVAVFAQGGFAVTQVDVHVEHGRGGQGGGRGQAKQQEQPAQHASSHNKGMGAWCHGCAGEGCHGRAAGAVRTGYRGALGRIRRRCEVPCPPWRCLGGEWTSSAGRRAGRSGVCRGAPRSLAPFSVSRGPF